MQQDYYRYVFIIDIIITGSDIEAYNLVDCWFKEILAISSNTKGHYE